MPPTRARRPRGSSVPTPALQVPPLIGDSFAGPSPAMFAWDQPEPNPDVSSSFQPSLPLPSLPPLPSIMRSVDESYNAAPPTSWVTWAGVPQTAAPACHQQQRADVPSQDPCHVHENYAHPGMISTPSTPTSWYSHRQVSQTGSYDVDCLDSRRARSSQSQRDEKLEQVIKFASISLINEMALNCGWRQKESSDAPIHARQVWSDKITECIVTGCVRFDYPQFNPTATTTKRIVRSLSVFRSKMALMAENYGRKFFQVGGNTLPAGQAPDLAAMQHRVAQITDPSLPGSFFLHKQNDAGEVERLFGHPILEEFHLDCWYTCENSPVRAFRASYNTTTANMLALSSMALLCALHCILQGRCSNQGRTIKFSTETYADHFDNYRDGILSGLRHPSFSQPLTDRLFWLNTQGQEQMHIQGLASPQKLRPVIIPPAVAASISATGESSANARACSPACFDNPAVATGASTSESSQSFSYIPVQTGSTSPSFFSAQLPLSGSIPGVTPNVPILTPPSTSYQFTDPFM